MKTNALGKYQRAVIANMLTGWHIRVFHDWSNNEHTICLSDDDNSNSASFSWDMLTNFQKRGIVKSREVHSTVNPDTATYEVRLTADAREVLERQPMFRFAIESARMSTNDSNGHGAPAP